MLHLNAQSRDLNAQSLGGCLHFTKSDHQFGRQEASVLSVTRQSQGGDGSRPGKSIGHHKTYITEQLSNPKP